MEQLNISTQDGYYSNNIIENHIEYAKRLACRFYSKRSHSQAEMDDVIASAYLGLCEAGTRYSRERGDHFQTFSYFRIIGSMYDYLQHNGGLSRVEFRRMSGKNKDNKKEPLRYTENISQLMQVKSQIENSGIALSYDAENNNVEMSYSNQELQDVTFYRREVLAKLRIAMNELDEEMQRIIVGKYFEGKSLTEIAQEIPDMSKSRVSRLHTLALKILRQSLSELYEDSI